MTWRTWLGATVAVLCLVGAAEAASVDDLIDGDAAVEAQRQGNFGPMKGSPDAPLGAIQRAWDGSDGRAGVLNVTYDPEMVVKVRIRHGMPLTIQLPKHEEVEKLILGSEIFQEKYKNGNRVVIDTDSVGADGYITILGATGRNYVIYARTESYKSSNTSHGLLVFHAPAMRPAMTWGKVAQDGKPTIPDFANPAVASRLNFNFAMSGDRSIAPDVVFSDGRFTYLFYAPDRWHGTDLPAVFRLTDKVGEPVNGLEVVGSTIVLKETGDYSLRSGRRFVCLRQSDKPLRMTMEKREPAL